MASNLIPWSNFSSFCYWWRDPRFINNTGKLSLKVQFLNNKFVAPLEVLWNFPTVHSTYGGNHSVSVLRLTPSVPRSLVRQAARCIAFSFNSTLSLVDFPRFPPVHGTYGGTPGTSQRAPFPPVDLLDLPGLLNYVIRAQSLRNHVDSATLVDTRLKLPFLSDKYLV